MSRVDIESINSSTQFHDDDEPQAYRERYRGVIVGSHPHFALDVIMNNSPRPVVPVRASVRIKIKAVDAFSLGLTRLHFIVPLRSGTEYFPPITKANSSIVRVSTFVGNKLLICSQTP